MGTWMLALGLRRRDVDPSLAYTITALAIVFGVYGSKVSGSLSTGVPSSRIRSRWP